MSFPALDQLATDIELGFTAWKVYMYLRRNLLSHTKPIAVKADALVDVLHMSSRDVRHSLNWLVERGYLIAHGRDTRGVRILSLAWDAHPPEGKAA